MTKQDAELAKWCSVLTAPRTADNVPEGWSTAQHIAKTTGKAVSTIRQLLARAVEEGRCEVQMFRVPNGSRGIYPTPHYRPK